MTDATAVRTERRAISAFSFERAVREFFFGAERARRRSSLPKGRVRLCGGGDRRGENRLEAPDELPYARVCDKVYQSKTESLLNLPEGFGIMNLPKFGGST